MNSPENETPVSEQYQVVALKYRPQSFADLVGQNHIASALSNAINQNRVGHAYLFTGARGVGKTSSARIFAKCLNCEQGPTTQPCNECDVCQTVSVGEDVDVLEIDGASNRGIDEIRQLRSNASVRPSRSRFKIYIIDEVHMLTTQAFNALLKTLEEPPPHVKFIFCTTDPQKIPITVLSRCQRFDFSPVQTGEIAQRLREIADKEGVQAGEDVLNLLARRANGSMRDSQSLLEQLLSFCETEITVEEVHQLLGTADVGRIAEIAAAMSSRDSAATLNLINQAAKDGVDAGQLASQLLGYFRDVMAVRVGCGEDTWLMCTGSDQEALTGISEQFGLETILTIVQVLDAAVVRMQFSLHARTLLEVAAIRICNLENLDAISDLVHQLSESGSTGAATRRPIKKTARNKVELKKVSSASPAKKKDLTSEPLPEPTAGDGLASSQIERRFDSQPSAYDVTPETQIAQAAVSPVAPSVTVAELPSPTSSPGQGATALSSAEIVTFWSRMLSDLGDMTADMASDYEKLDWENAEKIVVTLRDAYHTRECNKPERKQKIESKLSEISGLDLRVEFRASRESVAAAKKVVPKLSRVQQIRKLQEDEFIKQTISLFDAEITGFFEASSNKKS